MATRRVSYAFALSILARCRAAAEVMPAYPQGTRFDENGKSASLPISMREKYAPAERQALAVRAAGKSLAVYERDNAILELWGIDIRSGHFEAKAA